MRAFSNFPGALTKMPNKSTCCLGVAEIASRKAGSGFLAKRCKLKSLAESDKGSWGPAEIDGHDEGIATTELIDNA